MKPCPLCEGIGNLPEAAHEPMLRTLADKLGYRLQKKPAERQSDAPVDWAPVIKALSDAREFMGFGPAHYTGSDAQLRFLRRPGATPEQWITAIRSQRYSLTESLLRGRLTKLQASTYLSLETISRNFAQCLQNASPQQQPQHVKLSDGRWAEERDGVRRILSESETRSLGLEPT